MKDIGGYIELELKGGKHYWKNAIRLNCARSALKYVIRANNIKEIFVPYYTCPVVWQAIEEENCKINYYEIDTNLLPKNEFDKDSYVLYTNYFGVCGNNVKLLAKKYKNLILDNAQAFYFPKYGIASLYSPRKFFGVSDGGYLISDKLLDEKFEKDFSYNRFSHLIKRIEGGANFGYDDFNKNDDDLLHQDIKEMSNLTERILNNIDYKKTKKIRLDNYKYLENKLGALNSFKIKPASEDVPMYYPFFAENEKLRSKLIENHIYIPQCWRNIEEKCFEKSTEMYLKKYMFLLIIDQRYDKKDMERIVSTIKEVL